MGGILDGMPPKVHIDINEVLRHLARRRPGQKAPGVSQRNEADTPEILSGLTADGLTLGTPIGFIVRNRDARPADYEGYRGKFRPNHADYTYYNKYGLHDFRGGGRASARETVSWVVAGSIARQWLETLGITIKAEYVETNNAADVAATGDSTGGKVKCVVRGVPIGVGEPVFDKLQSRLAAAMMSINATKAFEYGDGTKSSGMLGSDSLDLFAYPYAPAKPTLTNHSGGIQGGISNGMPICFTVHFKPTPTLMRRVESIDSNGEKCIIEPRGRHDACVAIRAVPVVESMAALVIADLMLLRNRY